MPGEIARIRACCMARFWNQLDKADIAVPLVFTKYSDVAEMQHLHVQPQQKASLQSRANPVAIETQPEPESVAKQPTAASAAAAAEESSGASVMRQDFKPWKVRPEPSCKPKHEYQVSDTPFNNETQYQKDFKPWPIAKRGDHPWIPKPIPTVTGPEGQVTNGPRHLHASTEVESGVEKSEIADKVTEKEILLSERKKKRVSEKVSDKKASLQPEGRTSDVFAEDKGRAAVDALNRQIRQEVVTGSSYRNEFKAYTDVKPVKAIRAKSQYQPPDEKTSLETSYSATYRGEQGLYQSSDNKALERRRIRSLYSEPYREPSKQVEKPIPPPRKPKKTPAGGVKPVKKVKEKQAASGVRATKKRASENEPETKPEEGGKEKSKELNNKLAEAKE
uniref:Microtubule-associated protein 6a n=1 Tax=Paramormyrops kingsleyae TaxID=1676925 RepID=A0A3B3SV11_9TELE